MLAVHSFTHACLLIHYQWVATQAILICIAEKTFGNEKHFSFGQNPRETFSFKFYTFLIELRAKGFESLFKKN